MDFSLKRIFTELQPPILRRVVPGAEPELLATGSNLPAGEVARAPVPPFGAAATPLRFFVAAVVRRLGHLRVRRVQPRFKINSYGMLFTVMKRRTPR